ncbi:PD40 domain-containing protein [Thermoanaerobacter sp. A7A]|uniref:TolB family protein n=1 Tax=Thermoanaerobacter sp. A7A TaxID=1350366 RepID=UPI0004245D6E|nr:PD40 domain-containing protein [Thermoanaerobacter sp. A7A]
MRQRRFLIVIVGLVIVGLVAVPLLASGYHWTYLGPEDYRLAAMIDGTPVVFTALQDTDSAPPLTFKKVTPQNTLVDLQKEVFEISFKLPGEGTKVWVWDDKRQTYVLSHVEEGTYKKKIAKLLVDGKTLFLPANPEEESPLFLTPDKDKFWYFTNKGFWLIDFKGNAKKLSQDKFNGETYDELQEELKAKIGDSNAMLWWADNPVFSPDGSKVVYMTNRDCIDSGGSSLWLYDLATGEERLLIKNVKSENYRAVGWLDNSHVLYTVYYTTERNSYYISDISGKHEKVNLEGKQPYILGICHASLILYTPDYSASREICLVKVDLATNAVKEVYKKTLDGVLRDPCSLSPDGSSLAFMYSPDSNDTIQYLAVVNLVSKKETLIKRLPLTEGVKLILDGFNWLDDTRLLIRATKVVNGTNQISSWIYNVEG